MGKQQSGYQKRKRKEKEEDLIQSQRGAMDRFMIKKPQVSSDYQGHIMQLEFHRGIENWVFNVMKDSFPSSSPDLSSQEATTRKYVPRKNSAPYAIVITLYREMKRGRNYMMKQELTDAAEASGLSESSIGPNNTRAKPGNSQNDFYTGWSCMNKLITKKLVEKWSNPAKYMLTEEGEKTVRDCLEWSGLDDTAGPSGQRSEVVPSDIDSDEPYEGVDLQNRNHAVPVP